MSSKKASKIGFSVLDLILVVLAAVCILSFVLKDQIRGFFSGEEGVTVEYTFLIENVSEEAKNIPSVGEELILSGDFSSLGIVSRVTETQKEYHAFEDEMDTVTIRNLTCQATVTAEETERGFLLGEIPLKAGAEFSVETESAGFTMVVTMVKVAE